MAAVLSLRPPSGQPAATREEARYLATLVQTLPASGRLRCMQAYALTHGPGLRILAYSAQGTRLWDTAPSAFLEAGTHGKPGIAAAGGREALPGACALDPSRADASAGTTPAPSRADAAAGTAPAPSRADASARQAPAPAGAEALAPDLVALALKGCPGGELRRVPPENRLPGEPPTIPVVFVAQPIPGGALLLVRSLLEEELSWLAQEQRMLEVVLPCLALAAVLSWWLARLFSEPLERTVGLADRLSSGDLQVRLALRGPEEFARLATAMNRMAQQVEERYSRMHCFLQDASHELRTPLASSRALLDALQAGALDDPVLGPRFLQLLTGETQRLEKLVREIMELERPQLVLEPVPLHPLLQELGASYGAQVEVSPGLEVVADARGLRQILLNLLENARRATHGKPSAITLGARREETGCQVFVGDAGPGIPLEARERVFERFHRLERRREGGFGLGLAICRRLVEAHRGRIWVEGGPGQNRVCFWLPSDPQAKLAAQNAHQPEPQSEG